MVCEQGIGECEKDDLYHRDSPRCYCVSLFDFAGIGILNIMLVSVTERIPEIGLRKAVGAKSFDIRLQFLTESVLLCLIGSLLGILLGAVAGKGFAWIVGKFLQECPGPL